MSVIEEARAAMHRVKAMIRHHEMADCYQVIDDVIDWLASISSELEDKAQTEDMCSRLFLDLEGKVEAKEAEVAQLGEEAALALSDPNAENIVAGIASGTDFLPPADPKLLADKGIKIFDADSDVPALEEPNSKIVSKQEQNGDPDCPLVPSKSSDRKRAKPRRGTSRRPRT